MSQYLIIAFTPPTLSLVGHNWYSIVSNWFKWGMSPDDRCRAGSIMLVPSCHCKVIATQLLRVPNLLKYIILNFQQSTSMCHGNGLYIFSGGVAICLWTYTDWYQDWYIFAIKKYFKWQGPLGVKYHTHGVAGVNFPGIHMLASSLVAYSLSGISNILPVLCKQCAGQLRRPPS